MNTVINEQLIDYVIKSIYYVTTNQFLSPCHLITPNHNIKVAGPIADKYASCFVLRLNSNYRYKFKSTMYNQHASDHRNNEPHNINSHTNNEAMYLC